MVWDAIANCNSGCANTKAVAGKIATIPVADNICHSQTVEGVPVNGCESLSRNSRLGTLPCNERYASIAWTANSGALPWPIYTKQPLRKGSVLET